MCSNNKNRGGLPETTTNAVILKNLNSTNLFKAIEDLIQIQIKEKITKVINSKFLLNSHAYIRPYR